ncbi:hypothetical protein MUO66_05240 [Candidatus Bathyarchaeota archaeon]|nr:hypothetical protein [Candidatus Bathyarchaeota archaeon]
MQIVTMMGQMLESGKVTLSTKNKESIEIIAVNKKIDVNAKNKELIKDIIAGVRDGGKNISVIETAKETPNMLKSVKRTRKMLIDIAEELKAVGITITLSYKGNVVATMGAQATAKISRLVTGTKAIEINNMLNLIELGI